MFVRSSKARSMNELETIMAAQIRQHGPISVGAFMALALGHPQHGYYMKQDPFGRQGDFITAPEVSQMFGEMIAAWLVDVWEKSGAPKKFSLVECGPGRGTLMADILRATKAVPGFHDNLSVYLLEMSPILMAQQKQALAEYDVNWHSGFDDVPDDCPLFVIGNEFFDALPVQQLIKTDEKWAERRVCLNEGEDGFEFCAVNAPSELLSHLPQDHAQQKEGMVFEVTPYADVMMHEIAARIQTQSGGFLFIDYGHIKSGYGETLQAVKEHEYTRILEEVGDCDLTVHVDFERMQGQATRAGVQNIAVTTQGGFLKALGIEYRAQALSKNANEAQQKEMNDALIRLSDTKQMGELFKVMGGVSGGFKMEGFG